MLENDYICTKMETKERERKMATQDQNMKNSCTTEKENQTSLVNAY